MKRRIVVASLLLLLLLLSQGLSAGVLAGSSANYKVDWSNLLAGGGGTASSTAYRAQITVGQTVDRAAQSPRFEIQMGYWAAGDSTNSIYLPLIKRGP